MNKMRYLQLKSYSLRTRRDNCELDTKNKET